MPLVRITLHKGRSPTALRQIADAVYAALVETYSVPADDRFQIIEQKDLGEIIYDKYYMGVERTDDIVIVNVIAGHWRDVDAKRALYRVMAENLARDVGMRKEDVQVILTPNDKPDWSFGNGIASYTPGEATKTA